MYLVLEFCDGGDLSAKLKHGGLLLQEPELATWMSQILSGLLVLHGKSIAHRDVKPKNIMIHGDKLKLSDFGLAITHSGGKKLRQKCGTHSFMSPEQHNLPRFSDGYTVLCDLWAVGICMYMMMFSGRHPFLDKANKLDKARMLSGTLDAIDSNGYFHVLLFGPAYSQDACLFCKKLVEPDPNHRLTAERALRDPWFSMECLVLGQGVVEVLEENPDSGGAPRACTACCSVTPPISVKQMCRLDPAIPAPVRHR